MGNNLLMFNTLRSTYAFILVGNPMLVASVVNSLHNNNIVVFVALLFYVHGKHLRSCRDGQLT